MDEEEKEMIFEGRGGEGDDFLMDEEEKEMIFEERGGEGDGP